MRLKVDYNAERIPRAYNTLFMSLIKEAFKKSDEEYFKKLYFYKDNMANKKSKNLTFSIYVKDYEIKDKDMIVNDRVSVIFSTPDLELGLILYNGLLKLKTFEYKKEYHLNRLRMDLIKEKVIDDKEVTLKTLSPICIKNKEGYFINIDSPSYEEELNYITNIVLESYRGYGLKERLRFTDVDMKKVVVKEELREFKNKTGREYECVNSYKGLFKLSGDKEDLKDIYMLGIGNKRSQGFGNVEIV